MIRSWFFPSPVRSFRGQRWVRISLRTCHLLAMGFLLGGYAQGMSPHQLNLAFAATLTTGLLFVAIELHASFIFLFQLKGIAVIVKSLLLAAAWAEPEAALACMIVAVIIGGISSHMPGKFRYFSPIHGRIVKE